MLYTPKSQVYFFSLTLMPIAKKELHYAVQLPDTVFEYMFYACIRLMALNRAMTEAVIISVSMPAPQEVFPSGAVMPI